MIAFRSERPARPLRPASLRLAVLVPVLWCLACADPGSTAAAPRGPKPPPPPPARASFAELAKKAVEPKLIRIPFNTGAKGYTRLTLFGVADTPFAALSPAEVLFVLTRSEQIPTPDFVNELKQRWWTRPPGSGFWLPRGRFDVQETFLGYDEIPRFRAAYEAFLVAHPTPLQRQAAADEFQGALLRAHAEYRELLDAHFRSLFRYAGTIRFTETDYDVRGGRLHLDLWPVMQGLLFAICGEEVTRWKDLEVPIGRSDALPIVSVRMSVAEAEALIARTATDPARVTVLYRPWDRPLARRELGQPYARLHMQAYGFRDAMIPIQLAAVRVEVGDIVLSDIVFD